MTHDSLPMNNPHEHLQGDMQNQLREIAEIFVKAVDPEKAILFGNHATGQGMEHRDTQSGMCYEFTRRQLACKN